MVSKGQGRDKNTRLHHPRSGSPPPFNLVFPRTTRESTVQPPLKQPPGDGRGDDGDGRTCRPTEGPRPGMTPGTAHQPGTSPLEHAPPSPPPPTECVTPQKSLKELVCCLLSLNFNRPDMFRVPSPLPTPTTYPKKLCEEHHGEEAMPDITLMKR